MKVAIAERSEYEIMSQSDATLMDRKELQSLLSEGIHPKSSPTRTHPPTQILPPVFVYNTNTRQYISKEATQRVFLPQQDMKRSSTRNDGGGAN
jgi:hypothetical protein